MNTIQAKLDAAANQVGQTATTAANSVKKGAQATANGAATAFNVLGDPAQQRQVAARLGEGVDRVYSNVGITLANANNAMETKGEAALKATSPLSNVKISQVDATGSAGKRAVTHARNGLAKYHTLVANIGDQYARNMGKTAHAFTSALLSPIRFVAKLLQVEVAGALFQNSVALAVGFVVRGIVLAATQVMHALPYAIGIVALGAAALGSFVGGKALIAAVGTVAAVIGALYAVDKLITGGLMFNMHKKVQALSSQQTSSAVAPQKSNAQAAKRLVNASFRTASKHKGKIAAATIVTGAAAAAYFFGIPTPVAKAGQDLVDQARNLTENVPSFETMGSMGSDAATAASNAAANGYTAGVRAFEGLRDALQKASPTFSFPASYQLGQNVTNATVA